MVDDEKVILILDVLIHEESCLLFKDRKEWEKWLRNDQVVYSLRFELLAGNFKTLFTELIRENENGILKILKNLT